MLAVVLSFWHDIPGCTCSAILSHSFLVNWMLYRFLRLPLKQTFIMDSISKSDELINVNKELAFQKEEKKQRAEELAIANKELLFQNVEKEKRAEELVIANKELIFQNAEKEKRAAELVIANKELVFQNAEREKRDEELVVANKELVFQNQEKEKRAAELIIANEELLFQNEQKEKMTTDLIQRNKDLEQFSYIVSHNLRAPVANIIGLSAAAQDEKLESAVKKEVMDGLTHSVKKLDDIIINLNNILKVKHQVNEKKEIVNFSQLANDIHSSIENLIEKEK